MTSRLRIIALSSAVALGALLAPKLASAQDTTQKGVRIGLTYDAGSKPGIIVMPVDPANGDSIRAMLMRDFDFSDRLTVITLDSASAAALNPTTPGQYNFSTMAQMGAKI